MNINLVKDGIFPIIFDKDGNQLNKKLDTGLKCSGTVQGEGKLVGTTCLFIRTSGCNLRCSFRRNTGDGDVCDTPFSSWDPDKNLINVDEVISIVKNNLGELKYVVITGGEPMLQHAALAELTRKLKLLNVHITLETNGTMFNQDVIDNTDLISISPKLSNSIPWKPNLRNTKYEYEEKRALKHAKIRINIPVIQDMIDSCYIIPPVKTLSRKHNYERKHDKDFQLKFVVSSENDIHEIKNDFLVNLFGVEPTDVVLMPLGSNRIALEESLMLAMTEAIKNGWRYTPRLHVDLFNDKRSV